MRRIILDFVEYVSSLVASFLQNSPPFDRMTRSHTGENLATEVFQSIQKFGIEEKVLSFFKYSKVGVTNDLYSDSWSCVR